jgi:hypothetical protein
MTSPVTVSQGKVKTAAGDAPVIPLLMVGFGAYLMWFAVKYWRGAGPAVWPSYPVKSVLQGKGIPANQTAQTAAAAVASYEATLPAPGQNLHKAPPGPAPTGQPQNMARMLLSRFGWGAGEMAPLISLWTQESGWNPKARNPSSGALGIAQALGHGTSGTGGTLGNEYGAQYGLTPAEAQAANSGSALQQIRWGLGYIKARYHSPAAAWQHEQTFGSYMQGGTIPPGQTGIVGEEGRPEYVTAGPGGAVVTPGAPQPSEVR